VKTKLEGAKIIAKKRSENFPLHNSIIDANLDTVINYCKNTNSDNLFLIDCYNEKGDTPLMCAINGNHEEIVDILLQSGADPNKSNSSGDTPLIAAVKLGSQEFITRLIEEGAKINKTNASEESPLKIATNLGNQNCINLLTEHGASFSSKQQTKSKHATFNTTVEYNDSMLDIISQSQQKKKSSEAFKKFCDSVIANTERYLDKKLKKLTSTDNLARVFAQLQELDYTKCTEKDALNIARKTIVAITAEIKAQLINEQDTDSTYLMSKAESSVEERITQLKDENTDIRKTDIKSVQKSQEVTLLDNGNNEHYQKIAESQNLFDVIKEKVLCRTTNHDVVLIDKTTIKPHHPRTAQEATTLLNLTKRRLAEERNLPNFNAAQTKTHLEEIEKIIKTSRKEKRNLTNNEGNFIDQLLRPCKTGRIHILHFPSKILVNSHEELSIEAFETGATVHSFQYHEDVETKNDLIFAGIANINKLLDDGVHPDRIILQGLENDGAVMRDTAMQFSKRNTYFSQIYINSDIVSESDHRQFSITNPVKPNKNCPESLKKFLIAFTNIINGQKNTTDENTAVFTESKNDISLPQLISIYIKNIQEFLHNDSKHRNAALPKERVECIIGLTEVDDNHSGD